MIRRRPLTGCVMLLLACGLPGLADDPPKPAEAVKKPETETVKVGPFRALVTADGVFEAREMTEILLQPEVWGTFTVEKAVDQGTAVKAGDPVLWFDSRKIDEEIRNSEFLVETGRLGLQQAELDRSLLDRTAPLDLADAKQTLAVAQSELEFYQQHWEKLNRESAEQSLKFAHYNLENAQEELNQLEKMYKADDLTEETEEIILKRAKRSVDSAQLSLASSKVRYEETVVRTLPMRKKEVEEGLQRAEIALARLEQTQELTARQKDIELQKSRFAHERLQEKLGHLKEDRELMVVESPADGVVYYGQCDRGRWTTGANLAKQLRKGGSLQANTVLMTIVSHGELFVRLDVPEKELRHLRVDGAGRVIPTLNPKLRVPAKVVEIDLIAVKEGTYDVRVEIEGNGDDLQMLRPGMTCKVELVVYESQEALTVPSSAVFSDETKPEQKYVFVDVDGKGERRDVETGHESGGRTQITEGLKAGDVIHKKKPEM